MKDDIVIILDKKVNNHRFGRIVAWDTEAFRYTTDYGELQKFYNVNFYDGEEDFYTEKKEDIPKIMWEIFTKWYGKYKKVTFISHNTKYDLMLSGLIGIIKKGEIFGFKLRSDPIIDNNLYLNYGKIEFIDTFNYFKVPLEALAEQIGMSKVNTEEYLLPPEEWNKQLLITGKERVITDTHILYEYFQRFLNMGFVYGISIASTSFKTFRKQFLKGTIVMRKKDVYRAIRSYRGGRVEAYVINRWERVNGYDINSLYPYVMRNNRFSVKFAKEYERITLEEIEKNKDYHNFLVHCDFHFPKDSVRIPIMVKDDKSYKLVEKLKAKDVWITSAELLAGLEEGGEFTLYEGIAYESRNIFKEFVDYFYTKKRDAKTEFERSFYKLILNSSYGKFGQHNPQVKILRDPAIIEYILDYALKNESTHVRYSGKTYSIHDYDFITYRDDEEIYTAVNPIIIASEVTAFARLVNFEWQKRIGFDKVLYTDTDSFYVYDNVSVPTGKELGELKKEYSHAYAIFHGAKDYEILYTEKGKDGNIHIKYKQVLKGVPKHSVKIGDNTYEYMEFPTLLTTHYNNEGVEVHRKVKVVHREYDKLICDEYGICRPLEE